MTSSREPTEATLHALEMRLYYDEKRAERIAGYTILKAELCRVPACRGTKMIRGMCGAHYGQLKRARDVPTSARPVRAPLMPARVGTVTRRSATSSPESGSDQTTADASLYPKLTDGE